MKNPSIFLYIMVDPDKSSRCKLGITKNIQQRLKSYRTANPQCTFLETYRIPSKIHEKRIIDLVKDRFRVDSEYVHCDPLLVKNIVEGYMADHNLYSFV